MSTLPNTEDHVVHAFATPARPELARALAALLGLARARIDGRFARRQLAHVGRRGVAWTGIDGAPRVFDPWLHHDTAGAWTELYLAGVLPRAWMDRPDPPTFEVCLAFACDPEGIERAEALARELYDVLAPWRADGAAPTARIVWRYGYDPDGLRAVCDRAPALRTALDGAALVAGRMTRAQGRGYHGSTPYHQDALDARDWETAAAGYERRWPLPGNTGTGAPLWWPPFVPPSVVDIAPDPLGRPEAYAPVPAALRGREIRTLPNPFAPAVALWNTGYVPCDPFGADGVATLALPRFPASRPDDDRDDGAGSR